MLFQAAARPIFRQRPAPVSHRSGTDPGGRMRRAKRQLPSPASLSVRGPGGDDPLSAASAGCRTGALADLLQASTRAVRAVESPSNLDPPGFPADRFDSGDSRLRQGLRSIWGLRESKERPIMEVPISPRPPNRWTRQDHLQN